MDGKRGFRSALGFHLLMAPYDRVMAMTTRARKAGQPLHRMP